MTVKSLDVDLAFTGYFDFDLEFKAYFCDHNLNLRNLDSVYTIQIGMGSIVIPLDVSNGDCQYQVTM